MHKLGNGYYTRTTIKIDQTKTQAVWLATVKDQGNWRVFCAKNSNEIVNLLLYPDYQLSAIDSGLFQTKKEVIDDLKRIAQRWVEGS